MCHLPRKLLGEGALRADTRLGSRGQAPGKELQVPCVCPRAQPPLLQHWPCPQQVQVLPLFPAPLPRPLHTASLGETHLAFCYYQGPRKEWPVTERGPHRQQRGAESCLDSRDSGKERE